MMENLKLFIDCTEVLNLSVDDICNDNADILLVLRHLRRLNVHRLDTQTTSWDIIFSGGSFSDSVFGHLCTLITTTVKNGLDTCRITTLDLAYVQIQPEGYRMLVAMVREMPQLLQLSVTDCIGVLGKKLLVDAALRVTTLERLLIRSNLDDNAFDGLAEIRQPLALRDLRLENTNVWRKTLGAICRASIYGVLNLERLDLDSNTLIHDQAIHALAPMLASRVDGLTTRLIRLNLESSNFCLEVATCLLLALGHNKTVKHLNLSYNHFGVGFGDVLARFPLVNSSISDLNIGGVELELSGVFVGLLTALESNFTLTSLSIEGNELQDRGATAIFEALVKRAQFKPFKLVELRFNQITLDGLARIADIFDRSIDANVTHAHVDSNNERNEVNGSCRKRQRFENYDNSHRPSSANIVLVEELRLVKNSFPANGRLLLTYAVMINSIRRHVGNVERMDVDSMMRAEDKQDLGRASRAQLRRPLS
ncbi:hypothetical protein PsorP6_007549 [Peronosclerospora sorghi]|uniref:Uncharacterized protein n=1 Tax=Peronosclerospora sorghi TaxID=230839 RepID=A0ACC0WCV5_9STRA|nr:hypothetical protein PsorP6_007549 [Peronosclerospora sorghi]